MGWDGVERERLDLSMSLAGIYLNFNLISLHKFAKDLRDLSLYTR